VRRVGLTRRDLLKLGGVVAGAGALGGGVVRPLLARADTGWARAGMSWPAGQVLPTFAVPSHLDVADLTPLDGDTQALLTTLQGIVNRQQPRLYWILQNGGTDQTWLDTIGVPYTEAADPWTLVAKYRDELRGVLMWNQYLVTATDTRPSVIEAFPDLRDLIVATGAFVCWLDPQVQAEQQLFGQILSKYAPDTPYLGWFVAGHESHGVTLCSQHGVEVLAADFLTNATVFGGVRAPVIGGRRPVRVPALQDKVYVTFTYSEGDNVQYDEHQLRLLWDDPHRGAVPANWSINPLLVDLAPSMLSHYQRTATPNDLLVAGPSGAGYTYPGMWPGTTIEQYTRMTGRYMRRTGMDVIYALNRDNDTDLAMSAAVATAYRENVNPLGILYNWESTSQASVVAGLPVATQIGISSVSGGQSALAAATATWDGKSPLLLAIGCWPGTWARPTSPTSWRLWAPSTRWSGAMCSSACSGGRTGRERADGQHPACRRGRPRGVPKWRRAAVPSGRSAGPRPRQGRARRPNRVRKAATATRATAPSTQ